LALLLDWLFGFRGAVGSAFPTARLSFPATVAALAVSVAPALVDQPIDMGAPLAFILPRLILVALLEMTMHRLFAALAVLRIPDGLFGSAAIRVGDFASCSIKLLLARGDV